jgi:hypothetical protein
LERSALITNETQQSMGALSLCSSAAGDAHHLRVPLR